MPAIVHKAPILGLESPSANKSSKVWLFSLLLTLQYGAQPLISKRFVGREVIVTSSVLACEIVKVGFAFILIAKEGTLKKLYTQWNLVASLTASGLPATIYALQNSLLQISYKNLDSLTFSILNQTKLFFTALFAYVILRQNQSLQQIGALLLLIIAAVLLTVSEGSNTEPGSNNSDEILFFGIVPVLVASVLSGLASALCQWATQAIKQTFALPLSCCQNLFMVVPLHPFFFLSHHYSTFKSPDGESIRQLGFFHGWTTLTLIPVVLNAGGGILVGLITTYAGGVKKGFVSVSALLVTGLLQFIFDGKPPSLYCLVALPLTITMETYYRKRSKMANQTLPKMDYHGSVTGSLAPVMPRHSPMPTTPNNCTLQCSEHENPAPNFNIEVGSIYEVDHIYLPPRTPVQLKSMRVVMVSEKTALSVAVRFPSLESLQIYLCNSMREMYPALDEKFVMGTALADKVLYRQVPSQEFAEKKHLESFWLVSSASVNHLSQDSSASKGVCLSDQLKVNGMVRWGVRRQVRFLRRHEDNNCNTTSSSFIKGDDDDDEEEMPPVIDAEKEEDNEEEEEEEEEQNDAEDDEEQEEDIKDEDPDETNKNFKRKRYSLRHTAIRKAKKVKREKQKLKNNIKRNKCKLLVQFKNPKDRWSEERYKLAEKNLLEVMRVKGATANNPILRPELRTEARKRIGDTGLLDHLLKHMAGKVAPGGTERFRRRHNAEGAMEYWLENADLINIRKEAGVNDPYWIPPPGWKPGDCLTPDPISAQEFKFLKQEISMLKRDSEEMALSKKQMEEELRRLKREIRELQLKKNQQETPVTVISKDSEISLVTMEKYKEQLLLMTSAIMAKMEEKFGNFASKLEEKERFFSALVEATVDYAEKGRRQVEAEQKSNKQVQEIVLSGEEEGSQVTGDQCNKQTTTDKPSAEKATIAASEEKAAKIQRLKSGFRICKPQGTFLWPNMVRSPSQVQVEDLFMIPTPPSVSSSTVTAPPKLPNNYFPSHQHSGPVSPVKPVPERRAVKLTVSSVSDGSMYTPTNQINLNDPFNNGGRLCGTPSSRQSITLTPMMPNLFPSTKELTKGELIDQGGHAVEAESTSIGSTKKAESYITREPNKSASMPKQEGTWLALATPNTSTSDESCQG
nr:protein DYAD-like [Ipomoea batatas]